MDVAKKYMKTHLMQQREKRGKDKKIQGRTFMIIHTSCYNKSSINTA